MRKLVKCAMRGFQHHVEKYDGMYLIFFKESWYQYVLALQSSRDIHEDTQIYIGAAAEEDMDEALRKLGLAGVHFPVVTGDFAFEESSSLFNTPGVRDIKWFTPHSSLHPSLRGKKIAGFIYSRFLNQRGVGFLTDEHTPAAARLWTGISRSLGVPLLYGSQDKPLYSAEDSRALGKSMKLLISPRDFKRVFRDLEAEDLFVD
jgi:hypothetical protein